MLDSPVISDFDLSWNRSRLRVTVAGDFGRLRQVIDIHIDEQIHVGVPFIRVALTIGRQQTDCHDHAPRAVSRRQAS
jgi:hypothetical protein